MAWAEAVNIKIEGKNKWVTIMQMPLIKRAFMAARQACHCNTMHTPLLISTMQCRMQMGELETWTLKCLREFAKTDAHYLLELFDDDATVYEPFSKTGIVNGHAEIESFLKVFCKYTSFVVDIKSVKVSTMKNATNSTTAIVGIKRGVDVKFALDFEFDQPASGKKKIKKLKIRHQK